MVLVRVPTAHADAADDGVAVLERDAALEDHDLPLGGVGQAIEGGAGLAEIDEIAGHDVEGAVREGLVLRDFDASQPSAFHAREGDQIGAGVYDGDASTLGRALADDPSAEPWVWGGETTVTVRGAGRGGRNQELVLGALAQGWPGGLLMAFGTDGVDGASAAAGALLDEEVAREARERGLDPEAALADNDSATFFERAGGSLRCGPTGTNVADLLIYLPRA